MNTIDQNDLFRKFDFSSIITEQDDQTACEIIKSIIDSGGYFKNSPKYQTEENIFARQESVWLKYRMSFMFAVFMYLGREAQVSNLMAWSFMTNKETAENRDNLWHHHQHRDAPMLSGVYYAHIPEDVENYDLAGTELSLDGEKFEETVYVKPQPHTWLIYPSSVWHRPGINSSKENRFVIAADIQYI